MIFLSYLLLAQMIDSDMYSALLSETSIREISLGFTILTGQHLFMKISSEMNVNVIFAQHIQNHTFPLIKSLTHLMNKTSHNLNE